MIQTTRRTLRCAIYTRKSTEHGLEQEFNSLEAQREACEAYVKSQAHEGWRQLPERYTTAATPAARWSAPRSSASSPTSPRGRSTWWSSTRSTASPARSPTSPSSWSSSTRSARGGPCAALALSRQPNRRRSFADFWAPIDGKDGPPADYVSSLDADMKRRVCDAVERAYLDGETDGPRSHVATAWVVRGSVPG